MLYKTPPYNIDWLCAVAILHFFTHLRWIYSYWCPTKNLTLLVFTWDLKHSTLERGLKVLLRIKQGTLNQRFFFFLNWVLTFIIFLLVIIFFFRFIIVLVKGVFDSLLIKKPAD
jgi:hypothetical protein